MALRPEIARTLQLEKAVQATKETIKNFSAASKHQVNLSAESARASLARRIVLDLIEKDFIEIL